MRESSDFNNARVRDNDVDVSLFALHRRIESIDVLRATDVPLDSRYVLADLLDRSIQLLLAPTGEKDVSSLLGIPLRSSETNPAIAPRHNCDLSFQLRHFPDSLELGEISSGHRSTGTSEPIRSMFLSL